MERAKQVPRTEAEPPALNCEQQRIADWLKRVRFKKKLVGGVSEADVWKKLEELNSMYDAALNAERVRYDALLRQFKSELVSQLRNSGKL